MAKSLLIEFEANFPAGKWNRIFNADIALKQFGKFMESRGIEVIEHDLWNDFGWFLNISSLNQSFTVYLAKYAKNEKWQCTIECDVQPGFIMRILGSKEIPYIENLKTISSLFQEWAISSTNIQECVYCLSDNPKSVVTEVEKLSWNL